MMEENLFDELAADAKIDATNLDAELSKIPYLHAKWMKRYVILSRETRKAEAEYAKVKLRRSNYWQGLGTEQEYLDAPMNRKVLKTELADILAADDEVVEAKERVSVFSEVAVVVEKFVSALNSRGYSLGKAVDYVRWKNGG